MATPKKTKTTKDAPAEKQRSAQWKSALALLEIAFRVLVGWVLLTNFDHVVVVGAAFYALGSAAFIVVMHVIAANRK